MQTYELYSLVRFEALFSRSDTGAVIDPTDVVLYLRDPQGSAETLHFSADALVRQSEGFYSYDLELDRAGYWTYRFEGDGAVEVSSADTHIYVNHSAVRGSTWPTAASLGGVSDLAA